MQYNDADQLEWEWDGLDRETSYGYDSYGNLTSMTRPGGNTSRYDYDLRGLLTRFVDPLAKATGYVSLPKTPSDSLRQLAKGSSDVITLH